MKPFKLSRRHDARRGLIRNLSSSLILYEQIITTESKAKYLKPYLERLISQSMKDDLAAYRVAKQLLFDQKAVKKLFEVIVPNAQNQFKSRSGFIKSFRLPPRQGDRAKTVKLLINPRLTKVVDNPLRLPNHHN